MVFDYVCFIKGIVSVLVGRVVFLFWMISVLFIFVLVWVSVGFLVFS